MKPQQLTDVQLLRVMAAHTGQYKHDYNIIRTSEEVVISPKHEGEELHITSQGSIYGIDMIDVKGTTIEAIRMLQSLHVAPFYYKETR